MIVFYSHFHNVFLHLMVAMGKDMIYPICCKNNKLNILEHDKYCPLTVIIKTTKTSKTV